MEEDDQSETDEEDSDSDTEAGNLRAVKSETDPFLSAWFKQNSMIYVSPNHSCWNDKDMAKKVEKNRFGYVVKSKVVGLGNMLNKYADLLRVYDISMNLLTNS